jgi:hypothetical protein
MTRMGVSSLVSIRHRANFIELEALVAKTRQGFLFHLNIVIDEIVEPNGMLVRKTCT